MFPLEDPFFLEQGRGDRLTLLSVFLRLRIIHAEGLHGDLLHLLLGAGPVAVVGLHAGDLIHHLDALGDLAERQGLSVFGIGNSGGVERER